MSICDSVILLNFSVNRSGGASEIGLGMFQTVIGLVKVPNSASITTK